MSKNKLKLLAIFSFGLICGLVINLNLVKKNVVSTQPTVNNQANSVSNNQTFSFLNLPLEYFSNQDVQWGSAGKGPGDKITDYTQVGLLNKAVYQSYPSTDTTIKEYSSDIKPLKIRSIDEIMQEFSKLDPQGFGKTLVDDSYQKYGSLDTNYLPTDYITGLEKFDVDDDGVPETIVTYNFVGSADAGSYRSDIIKGSNIIFSVQEDNASIIQADTSNGFYVEWKSADDPTPRCCPDGFKRARFVFKDSRFVPVYEQEVRFLKIGKE